MPSRCLECAHPSFIFPVRSADNLSELRLSYVLSHCMYFALYYVGFLYSPIYC